MRTTRKKKNNVKFEQTLPPSVRAKNAAQEGFLYALGYAQVPVLTSPAGTGKTYVAVSECADWLKRGDYNKLILTRPAVGMGRSFPTLPGDIRGKFEPYLTPIIEVLVERYGKGFYETGVKNGNIEFAPLELIRGRSIRDLVILDEAQNATPDEMYALLTRIEQTGKLIILGDPAQNDLKGREDGITWLKRLLKTNPDLQDYITVAEASSDDIVRGGLCKRLVKAKEKNNV